jgi:hypothetical protein
MEKINARQAHENGDVEQSHRRFKDDVDQALMLRIDAVQTESSELPVAQPCR